MTIICAYTDGLNTWIGSDQLIHRGSLKMYLPTGKWLVRSGWAIAFAGATMYRLAAERSQDLLDHADHPMEVVQSLAAVWRVHGISSKRDEQDGVELFETVGVIARKGKIWDVDGSLAYVEVPANRLVGGGSGWAFAEGCAWGLQQRVVPTPGGEYLVKRAVECACVLDSANCEGLWQARL